MTELVFILDRSGSMYNLTDDTIGGFNAMLHQQKEAHGDAYVTTVLFNNRSRRLHDRLPIQQVPLMTTADYSPGGSTALLDAVGSTIRHIASIHKYAPAGHVPDKTLFVIITDGMENASREYSYDRVKALIAHEQEKYGWEFIFLGANIDAAAEGARFGIAAERAVTYKADSDGTALNFQCISEVVSDVRDCRPVAKDWRERIDRDVKERGK